MVLTDKDLVPKTPIIKKPRTFNPLGAIFFGLFLGIGHTLIYLSLIRKTYLWYFSIFGFILVILAAFFVLANISITAKSIVFLLKLDKSKTLLAQLFLQILVFYLGFLPIYGFIIVYLEQKIALWQILVTTVVAVVLFSLALIFNIYQIQKVKATLGDLKKLLYQPKRPLIICISVIVVVIVTAIVFVF